MIKRPVRIRQSNGEVRVIGFISGNTFKTYRTEKRHLYRGGCDTIQEAKNTGLAAWGIDAKVCDGVLKMNCTIAMIIAEKYRYIADLRAFKEHENAFVLHHKPHCAQYFLPLSEFEKERRVEPQDKEFVKLLKGMKRK